MAIKSWMRAAVKSVQIAVLIVVFWLLGPRADHESERIYTVLAEFIRNGQLVIETLPPLSYLFVSWEISQVFYLAVGAQCAAFCLFALSLARGTDRGKTALTTVKEQMSQGRLTKIVGLTLWSPTALVVALYSWRVTLLQKSDIGVLGSTSGLSDGLLLTAFLLLGFEQHQPRTGFIDMLCKCGIIELTGLAAYFFGCDSSQFCGFLLLLMLRIYADLVDVASPSLAVAVRVAWKALVLVVLASSMALLAYDGLLPYSEVAFTGNYHLNMLPPNARRALRLPNVELPAESSPLPEKLNSSSFYTISAGAPYSIYIPAAGFLFADNLVWDPFGHGFVQDEDYVPPEDAAAYQELTQTGDLPANNHRVYFEDRLGVELPWQFLPVGKTLTNYNVDPDGTDPLDSDTYVIIRHLASGEFLTVEPGVFAVVDRELMIEAADDGFSRLHIRYLFSELNIGHATFPNDNPADPNLNSLSEGLTPSVVWQLTYDPKHDTGLRLFSPENSCFLSTSFRSFPDFHGLRPNDTIADELAMEVEATCINTPSERAQTLFVVDGEPHECEEFFPNTDQLVTGLQSNTATMGTNPTGVFNRFAGSVKRAWGTYSAVSLLSEFRTLFPNLQDVPRSLLQEQFTAVRPERESILIWSFVALLLLWSVRLLYRQRAESKGQLDVGKPFLTWADIGVYLALARLAFFALQGFANGTSGRVAAVLSVHSWLSLYRSALSWIT